MRGSKESPGWIPLYPKGPLAYAIEYYPLVVMRTGRLTGRRKYDKREIEREKTVLDEKGPQEAYPGLRTCRQYRRMRLKKSTGTLDG